MARFAVAITASAALAFAAGAAQAAELHARASSYRGTRVTVADAPWVVSLTAFGPHLRPDPASLGKPGWKTACSGVVIGPKLVLTASHCVDDHDLTQIGVSVGTDDLLRSPGRVVPIARAWSAILHGRFQPGHDTALVETTKPLGVPALPLATSRPLAGETVSSFGYGDDRADNPGDDSAAVPAADRLDRRLVVRGGERPRRDLHDGAERRRAALR